MVRKRKTIDSSEQVVERVEQRAIGDEVRQDYIDYSNYITNFRHIVSIKDGCKPSYKKLIYTALKNFSKNKLSPSASVIASIATLSDHGSTGVEGLNANLVLTGVFTGEGAWGFTSIDGVYNPYAAPRYCHQMVSPVYREIFDELLEEVKEIPSEVGPLECEYLPLPIPLALYMKTQVMGLIIGKKAVWPNFSPQSMYQALINDNPQLLEPNANLLIDKEKSELDKLWYQGSGKIVYSFKLTRSTDSFGNPGILFEGDTFLFTPNFKNLKKLAEEGKVFMEDLTDLSGPKMIVSRVSGARGISIEDIEEMCRKVCYSSNTYTINVTDGNSAFKIPLREWLRMTYSNFLDLCVKHNQRKIDKVSFDIAVLENLPKVSNYIINENPKAKDDELSRVLGIHPDIISAIMSKPISYIRNNKDNSTRLKNLKDQLKELKKFDPVKYTEEIIKKL